MENRTKHIHLKQKSVTILRQPLANLIRKEVLGVGEEESGAKTSMQKEK